MLLKKCPGASTLQLLYSWVVTVDGIQNPNLGSSKPTIPTDKSSRSEASGSYWQEAALPSSMFRSGASTYSILFCWPFPGWLFSTCFSPPVVLKANGEKNKIKDHNWRFIVWEQTMERATVRPHGGLVLHKPWILTVALLPSSLLLFFFASSHVF